MSNEEESLLALLCESLGNGQRGNAPIFINFNSFNGPVGQHNDHADTVNFSMDKDGTISFQHIRRTGKSIIQPEVMAKALERTMEEGYWWASTAWAVAYRIYQMEGWAASASSCVRCRSGLGKRPWHSPVLTTASRSPSSAESCLAASTDGKRTVQRSRCNGWPSGSSTF